MGFNDTAIGARTLDDAEGDVYIMDDIRMTLYKVLSLSDITTSNRLRKLIKFMGEEPQMDSMRHKNVIDEEECPESFSKSASCVRVVTQIIVLANADVYDDDTVKSRVLDPVREAMLTDLFVDSTEVEQIQEVEYLGEGVLIPGDFVPTSDGSRSALNEGGIAGLAVGSVFFVAAAFLIGFSRSRAHDDREDESPGDSSDASYTSELDPIQFGKRDVPLIEGSDTFEATDVSRSAQFDLETGGVVPPIVSEDDDDGSSSNYSDSDKEGELLIGRLDAAVTAGDWAAVAAIAGDLSTADEASTFSSHSPKFHDALSREGLSPEDAKRAATIDKLISEGDWNAVGATAAAFDSDGSTTTGSELSRDNKSKNISGDSKKKSILDFIAGPWQSSAASKAIAQDGAEGDIEDTNMSANHTVSDGISSLSGGGMSPDRQKMEDVEIAAAEFPPMIPPHGSESSTTDSDTRPIAGKQQSKKSWRGRIPSIRRKENSEEKVASKSLALQEDSSVSSWSHGSPSSPSSGFVPYGDKKLKAEDNVPEEMKAFGEDFGLAAAELALRQEEEAKEESEDEEISQKSSNSLRDELDKAIESGDWAAVEAQTNKMFDVSMEGLKEEEKPRSSNNSMSSYDDESDEDSQEGWSTGSKSMSGTSDHIDDERIAMLEKLIETDDWQGIVTASRVHNRDEDSSMTPSLVNDQVDGLISLATENKEIDADEDISLATDIAKAI